MAELLVMIAPIPTHANAVQDAMTLKAGDVITVQEDGYDWGKGDLEGHAKLIKIPGVPILDVMQLAATNSPGPGQLKQIRMYTIPNYADLDSLTVSGETFIATHCVIKRPQEDGTIL